MSRTVREVFVSLYEEGLIYRGKYIINWCPRCKTALADDEVEHHEDKGSLWYIKYPFVDNPSDGIVVATTRPETMLGDTAVAVNPADERFKHLIGKKVLLPLVQPIRKGITCEGEPVDVPAEIPIVGDWEVSREFGTGAVKITPAHDPNDYWIGKRHELPIVEVINEKASMTAQAGEYVGQDRYEARKGIVEDLAERKLLIKTEPHIHSVGHCYRCHTAIEPYLSAQWFVKMKPLAKAAIEIVRRGEVKFIPERWEGVYYNWMNNIRDWCISRQLWWGHQIPVWYGPDDKIFVARNEDEAITDAREYYRTENVELRRDPDVLDTWFSSWLWPLATMGWPDMTDDLKNYYPTDLLITASEIIFFWVARMIMSGEHFCGEKPFHTVYIHGTVRDSIGRKMSKSLGNGIDPLDVVEQYGRDALRFTLISQAGAGQDLFLEMKSFEVGRNFANKLWNASRLLFLNLQDSKFTIDELKSAKPKKLAGRWIMSRFAKAIETVNEAFETFSLDDAVRGIHQFFWGEFCDWYLESTKLDMRNDRDEQVLTIAIFETLLKLMHPILPYLTEELWHKLGEMVDGLIPLDDATIMFASYPEIEVFEQWLDEDSENQFSAIQEVIDSIRNIKGETGLGTKKTGTVHIIPSNRAMQTLIEEQSELIKFLARVDNLQIVLKKPIGACGTAAVHAGQVFLPLEELVDIDKEIARLKKEIEKLEHGLQNVRKKLSNDGFTAKAPEKVVKAEREKEKDYSKRLEILAKQLTGFEK